MHWASRGLGLAPRPPHIAVLSRDGEIKGSDDHLGERGASRGSPGDRSARSPGWRRIVTKWKAQYDTGINSACTHASPAVRILLYCCSTCWVGRLVREGWWFGRFVDGWTSGFVAMYGSRVCSFAFWTHGAFITHSTMERCVRTGHTSTAVRYCCTKVLL